jgi:hypothetical protein
MSTLLDAEVRDICWLSPASSVRDGVDVAGEVSEWELYPFSDLLQIAAGGGTLDGQFTRETIDLGGPIAVRAHRRFGFSVGALDPPALEFLG